MAFEGLKGFFHIDHDHDDYEDDFDEFDEFDDDLDAEEEYEKPAKKGLMERFTSKNSKEEDEDDYSDFSAPVVEREPEKKPVKSNELFGTKKSESRVINMSKQTSNYGSSAGQIFMLKPKKIDDAKSAVDALLSNKIVILNLEGISLEVAQSVTDFISGASYCISGNFSTISQNVFVYTPRGIDLTGAFDEDILSGRDY